MKRLLVFVSALLLAVAAQAQTGKTTRMLVGFPPGNATDVVARIVAERLGPMLGEHIIVENRPGQGASLAVSQLARSPADGSTMMLSAMASLVTNPHLYRNVGYDTLKDLEPVATLADLPLLLVANPDVPAQSLQELIAYATANPGKLSHSSSGSGTISHLAMEDLKRRAKLSIMHVPYPGSPRAMMDLVGGTVNVGLDTITVTQPLIQSGKLRLLAVGTEKRLEAFANVPTIAEQGFTGFHASAWLGMIYPAGTPKERVERTSAAIEKIVRDPEVAKKLIAIGAYPQYRNASQFRAFLQSEYGRWGEIVKASGAKVD